MTKIFVSYRRADAAGHAGRIFDRLCRSFGLDQVFMDVVGIEPGVDFEQEIDRAVGACDVIVVVIGRGWAGATNGDGRRKLEDSSDFVRLEVATALKRGVRVVPVLVNGAVLPKEHELPDDLKGLIKRQALELRDDRWDADVAALVRALGRLVRPARILSLRVDKWHGKGLVLAIAGTLAVGTGLFMARNRAAAPAEHPDPRAVQLFKDLEQANLVNGTAENQIMEYLTSDPGYRLLGAASLRMLAGRRLRPGGADIAKVHWLYLGRVGIDQNGSLPSGHAVDEESLQAALLEAYVNLNGRGVSALADAIE